MVPKKRRSLLDILLGIDPEEEQKEAQKKSGMRKARYSERWTPVTESYRTVRNVRATKQAPRGQEFVVSRSGRKLTSIAELRSTLPELSDEQFADHVSGQKNDFATWIRDVFHETTLANMMRRCHSRAEMIEILKRFCNRKHKNA
jgi:hypothetical protein